MSLPADDGMVHDGRGAYVIWEMSVYISTSIILTVKPAGSSRNNPAITDGRNMSMTLHAACGKSESPKSVTRD